MSSRFILLVRIFSIPLIFSLLCPSQAWAKRRYRTPTPTPTYSYTPTETLTPNPTPVPLSRFWTGDKFYTFDAMWGSKGTDLGKLNVPEGIAADPSDNLYICDTANNRIQLWNSEGKPLRSIGSFGTSATWRNAPQFNHPGGVLVLPSGQVFVADTQNHRVVVVDSNDLVMTSWGSQGVAEGQFNQPRDIKRDQYGNIWVLDSGNSRVQNFSNMGTFNFARGGFGTQNGQFNLPLGFALNGIDQAIVSDTGNFRFEVFNDLSKAATNLAPITIEGMYGDGPFQFKEPAGVAVSRGGLVAIVDGLTARVEFFNSLFEFLGEWRAKDDILSVSYSPRYRGAVFDSQDRLYLTDLQNNCIVRLRPLAFFPSKAPPSSSANRSAQPNGPALPIPTLTPEDSTPYGQDYPIR
jgi:streptogramin lyase